MIDVLRDYPGMQPDQALQAAIENGGMVYAGPPLTGEYRLDIGTLRTRGNLRLMVDPRVTIVRTQAIGMFRNVLDGDGPTPGYSGHGNIHVTGGQWNVNGATGGAASAFSLSHAEDITLRDLTILDVPGAHAADVMACRKVKIENVSFYGFRDTGDRDFSEAVQIDGAFGAYGGVSEPYDSTPCDDVRVEGCRFSSSDTLGVWPRAVGSHGYEDDVAGHEHRAIRVADCILNGSSIRAWHWTRSKLTDVLVTGAGLTIQNSSEMTMADCEVYAAPASGIWINSSVTSTTIRDCKVIGASRGVNNKDYGIRASGAGVDDLRLIDNTVRKLPTGNNAKWGMSLTSDCKRVRRCGNDLRTSGVSGSLEDHSVSPVTSAGDVL